MVYLQPVDGFCLPKLGSGGRAESIAFSKTLTERGSEKVINECLWVPPGPKMLKPHIACLLGIKRDLGNRPNEETDCINETNLQHSLDCIQVRSIQTSMEKIAAHLDFCFFRGAFCGAFLSCVQ